MSHTSLTSFLFLLLLVQLSVRTLAVKHLRRGPAEGSKEKVWLQGSTVIESGEESERQAKEVGFSANIVRDIVLWDEVVLDGATISSCSPTSAVLAGSALDEEDYALGTVFTINVEAWERLCAPPAVVGGIPEEDDVLFYEVTSQPTVSGIGASKQVALSLKRISGEFVMPEVEVDAGTNQGASASLADVGKNKFFEDGPTGAAKRQALRQGVSSTQSSVRQLNPTIRFLPGLNENTTTELSEGVTLEYGVRLDVDVSTFKFKRNFNPFRFRLKVEWEQRLIASASAKFEFSTALLDRGISKRIIEKNIPKIGFSSPKFPGIGRVKVGAFVRLDALLEVSAEVTFTAEATIQREIRSKVVLDVIKGRFSSSPLPARTKNEESVDINLEASGVLVAFAGVRPALAFQVQWGRKQRGVNIGVKAGLQVETTLQSKLFSPTSAGLVRIGVCNKCHRLQGTLAAVIKDLAVQTEKDNKVQDEFVLVENLVNAPLATLCLLPAQCPGVNGGGSSGSSPNICPGSCAAGIPLQSLA